MLFFIIGIKFTTGSISQRYKLKLFPAYFYHIFNQRGFGSFYLYLILLRNLSQKVSINGIQSGIINIWIHFKI